MAFPLLSDGEVLGALIYSEVAGAFDRDEIQLVSQLAEDLAFGVGALRTRSQHAAMTARLVVTDRLVAAGTLAAGVAHEINNPLAYVMSAHDFIGRELDRIAPLVADGCLDDAREALADARQGARRVKLIVGDLNTFARGDEHRLDPVDLRRVLDFAASMADTHIKYRARLVKDYGDDAPQVLGNEARLGQVFLNLLINASQAMPERRPEENEIRVTIRRDPGGRVVTEVRDTGAGIAPDVAERIFEPFFTTKPVGVGTGLGLSVCRNIVVAHGGEIAFETEVGRGTCFSVTLPPAAPPSARSAA